MIKAQWRSIIGNNYGQREVQQIPKCKEPNSSTRYGCVVPMDVKGITRHNSSRERTGSGVISRRRTFKQSRIQSYWQFGWTSLEFFQLQVWQRICTSNQVLHRRSNMRFGSFWGVEACRGSQRGPVGNVMTWHVQRPLGFCFAKISTQKTLTCKKKVPRYCIAHISM